jgi:hypothetical protein
MLKSLFCRAPIEYPSMMRYINYCPVATNSRKLPCYVTTGIVHRMIPNKKIIRNPEKADLILAVMFSRKTNEAVHSFAWTPTYELNGLVLDSSLDLELKVLQRTLPNIILPKYYNIFEPTMTYLDCYKVLDFEYFREYIRLKYMFEN